jgi:hypothetical protein
MSRIDIQRMLEKEAQQGLGGEQAAHAPTATDKDGILLELDPHDIERMSREAILDCQRACWGLREGSAGA